jgi:hypothetical protein
MAEMSEKFREKGGEIYLPAAEWCREVHAAKLVAGIAGLRKPSTRSRASTGGDDVWETEATFNSVKSSGGGYRHLVLGDTRMGNSFSI